MTVFKHELKMGKTSLIIWSGAVAFLLAVCVLIYPEMSSQMGDVSEIFAQMGGFSEAFGMDRINFGEFIGFFGVECGNTLGFGGAFFAALIGISALAREEKEHTAEFLLTHPLSRTQIIAQKLFAVLTQLVIFNAVVISVTALSVVAVKEEPDVKILALIFLSHLILQFEIACICFGISAFIRRGGLGIGLGLAAVMYFFNIIANLTEDAEFLKYITPFAYTDGSDIISNSALNGEYITVGLAFAVVSVAAAFYKYRKKDIA